MTNKYVYKYKKKAELDEIKKKKKKDMKLKLKKLKNACDDNDLSFISSSDESSDPDY